MLIIPRGLSSRKVGATSLNSKSSRSHIVFTFIIESWSKLELVKGTLDCLCAKSGLTLKYQWSSSRGNNRTYYLYISARGWWRCAHPGILGQWRSSSHI
ncbi:Kinesin-like protein [Parasponia andersonii]|uniref:Kinesin-like protein n=1 Tax=Parasponia andersonii TaxID=3476 RepID=A0A2P5B0C8_PARAD|nr:Kinesin-like protein [Parasponia andersonii]